MRHLVTGGASGIGAALVDRLHGRSDEVLLLVRSPERADEVAARWPGVRTLVADLGEPLAELDLPGELDSLVHSAGVVDVGHLADGADVERQVRVNLLAPAELTRRCLPALRAARGTVVFVNSTSGLQANPGWAGYNASKFGLRGFADALRAEEAPYGVRVSTVFPSRTASPMQEKVHAFEGKEYDASRWMSPETVAGAILGVLDLPADAIATDLTLRTHQP